MSENSGPTKLAVTIDAPGVALHGYLHSPQSGQPRLAIVIHPATGVPQSYYARFARWLAEDRQAAVLIYDYRDMGESSRGPMKEARATMSDWGVLDQSAALDFLWSRAACPSSFVKAPRRWAWMSNTSRKSAPKCC